MRFRTSVGTLMLASLLTACGGRASGGFHPSGQVASGGSGTTSAAPGAGSAGATPAAALRTPAAALAAYREYQRVYEQAFATNDTSALGGVATNPLLSIIVKNIRKARTQGVVWQFHNVLNPRVQGRSKDDSTVVILDCVQTLGSYRFSAKTGKRLNSWHNGNNLYQAIMKFADGTYKISDATQGRSC
jgi:hypothetical protein